jgi:uncharacterized coiled-coil DUF342 family protein
MSNEKKQENPIRLIKEIDDLEERLNELELNMVDAKEFTHISNEAFEALQEQITELREMFESLLSLNNTSQPEPRSAPYSEYH